MAAVNFGFAATAFRSRLFCLAVTVLWMATLATHASAGIIVFEAAGANPASITPTRDAFRTAVGGGSVAGAAGDFGGVRREINWDGVPAGFSDPTLLPNNFFNVNSPRGGSVQWTGGHGCLRQCQCGRCHSAIIRLSQRLSGLQFPEIVCDDRHKHTGCQVLCPWHINSGHDECVCGDLCGRRNRWR